MQSGPVTTDNGCENVVEKVSTDKDDTPECEENNDEKMKDGSKKHNELNRDFSDEDKCNSVLEENESLPAAEPVRNIDKENPKCDENNVIDEDDDDYLLYLEDILRRIHAEFYANIEKETSRKSLRDIIPRVRAQVLKGVNLTFSGLIPTHQKLHQSRAYKVARAFGAEVSQVI